MVGVLHASTSPARRICRPNHNVVRLIGRSLRRSLTEVLRDGPRALLAQAVEAEVAGFSASTPIQGYVIAPASSATLLCRREVMTGIGPVRSSAARA